MAEVTPPVPKPDGTDTHCHCGEPWRQREGPDGPRFVLRCSRCHVRLCVKSDGTCAEPQCMGIAERIYIDVTREPRPTWWC